MSRTRRPTWAQIDKAWRDMRTESGKVHAAMMAVGALAPQDAIGAITRRHPEHPAVLAYDAAWARFDAAKARHRDLSNSRS